MWMFTVSFASFLRPRERERVLRERGWVIVCMVYQPSLSVFLNLLGSNCIIQGFAGPAYEERWGGKVKHVNLVSNKLIRVKFPPRKGNEDDVSSVSSWTSLPD